jgi:hypothetical protein
MTGPAASDLAREAGVKDARLLPLIDGQLHPLTAVPGLPTAGPLTVRTNELPPPATHQPHRRSSLEPPRDAAATSRPWQQSPPPDPAAVDRPGGGRRAARPHRPGALPADPAEHVPVTWPAAPKRGQPCGFDGVSYNRGQCTCAPRAPPGRPAGLTASGATRSCKWALTRGRRVARTQNLIHRS